MAANINIKNVQGYQEYMVLMKQLCPSRFMDDEKVIFMDWTFEDKEELGLDTKIMSDELGNPLCMLFFKGKLLVDGYAKDRETAGGLYRSETLVRQLPKEQSLALRAWLTENGYEAKHRHSANEDIHEPASGGDLTYYTNIGAAPFDLCNPLPKALPDTIFIQADDVDMSQTRYVRGSCYASGTRFTHDTLDGIRFHDSEPTVMQIMDTNITRVDNVICDRLMVGALRGAVTIGSGVRCSELHSFQPVILPENFTVERLIVPKATKIPSGAKIGSLTYAEDVKMISLDEVVEEINTVLEDQFEGPDLGP